MFAWLFGVVSSCFKSLSFCLVKKFFTLKRGCQGSFVEVVFCSLLCIRWLFVVLKIVVLFSLFLVVVFECFMMFRFSRLFQVVQLFRLRVFQVFLLFWNREEQVSFFQQDIVECLLVVGFFDVGGKFWTKNSL